MSDTHNEASPDRLRLWPGVTIVALQWLTRFGLPVVTPEATAYAVGGGLLGGIAVLVWWLFFSRAARIERIAALLLIAAAMPAATLILHQSVATGMMGMTFWIFATPVVSLALVVWAVATRRLTGGIRLATMAVAIVAASGVWALLRTDGIMGAGSQFAWRWSPTHEERLLARAAVEPPAKPAPAVPAPPAPEPVPSPKPTPPAKPPARAIVPPPAPAPEPTPAIDWPGFRGPLRDGIIRGGRISTAWTASAPPELWRKPVGPGWSSFAAGGGLIYTQEQRGEFEIVAAYSAATGEPVWTHRDATRFWESNGGAGPRSTPTLHGGRVYTLGATGILNALDARDGALLWTRNAAADTGAKLPGWGFSSSPLVVDGLVIVAASSRLAAYEIATGNLRWTVQAGGGSYSSPHLLTIEGVEQVLLTSGDGVISVAPSDGKTLWKHTWPGSLILQPALADGGLLIASSDSMGGLGTRRLAVTQAPDGWKVEERWTSRGLKPYFNDFVVHNGHAFGFDGSILACIDLQDGQRKWKGGRYGQGQMILLPAQDLLLVLSEDGEVALVSATPDAFKEVARFRAMDGKTWNHPVVASGLLLVRNGQEMVAFRVAEGG